VNKDNLQYGAHSGIQKAVRRGDLNLAHTCFEIMWEEKPHQSWLKWRTPILVVEDAYYLVGEIAEFLKKRTDEKKDWKRLIYQITVAKKNKDSHGVLSFGLDQRGEDVKGKELALFRKFSNGLTAQNVVQRAHDAFDYITEKRKLTDYEMSAMQFLRSRASTGGMLWDRFSMISTMCLIATRGLPQQLIKEQMEKDLEEYFERTGGAKPREVPLPWYVFDMHTRVGMAAMSIFIKKRGDALGINRKQLDAVWFILSSGFVPDHLLLRPVNGKKPTCLETMWWDRWCEIECRFGKYNTKEKVSLLWPRIEKELKGIVEWLRNKD